MRRNYKFKQFLGYNPTLWFVKKRVIKFKRPKWKFLQNKIKFFKENTLRFSNRYQYLKQLRRKQRRAYIKVCKKYRVKILSRNVWAVKRINQYLNFKIGSKNIFSTAWEKQKRYFKSSISSKRSLHGHFDYSFTQTIYKTVLKKSNFFLFKLNFVYVRPEFKLDVLLCRLFFFNSIHKASQFIRRSLVSSNICYNINKSCYFVKLGSIYTLQSYNKKIFGLIIKNLKAYVFPVTLPVFIECDYFLGSFIVLYHWKNFTMKALSSVIHQPVLLKNLSDYFLH